MLRGLAPAPRRANRTADRRQLYGRGALLISHTESMFYTHGIRMLETRLGPVAWQSSGHGPALVFFAGALANHDLWRDVVAALEDRYRCVTVDLPLGAHPGR